MAMTATTTSACYLSLPLFAAPASTDSHGDKNSILVEVCTSPGCLADGAKDTLRKLQALAPSSSSTGSIVTVCEGDCQSLCGNGPIVVIDGTKKMRKVKGNKKLLRVLQDSSTSSTSSKEQYEDTSKGPVLTADQQKLFDALDLLDSAQERNKDKTKLNEANDLYTGAIGLGMELYNIEIEDDEDQLDPSWRISVEQVAWLIEAMQSQADCLFELKRYSDSADVMKSATHICRSCAGDNENNENTVKCLYACLERYQAALEQENKIPSSQDKASKSDELSVLEELLALSPPSDLSTIQRNKRRSLGFRLQKLQQERR